MAKRQSSEYFKAAMKEVYSDRDFNRDLLKPRDPSEVDDNFFKGKKVVVTGLFTSYNREAIIQKLYELGADVNVTISKRTDVFIVGRDAGPSKIAKAQEFPDLKIIYEDQLLEILNPSAIESDEHRAVIEMEVEKVGSDVQQYLDNYNLKPDTTPNKSKEEVQDTVPIPSPLPTHNSVPEQNTKQTQYYQMIILVLVFIVLVLLLVKI